MKNVFKAIFTLVIIIFIGYVIYRNMLLSTIPSVDLIKDEKTMSMYNNICQILLIISGKIYILVKKV